MNINIEQFFRYCYEARYERIHLYFHAYEYLLPIALIIVISDYNLLFIAVGIGFMQHLVLDQITNPVKPMAYFIAYRLKNKFSKNSLLKDDFLSSLQKDQIKDADFRSKH